MKRITRLSWTELVIGAALLLAACSPAPQAARGPAAEFAGIECQVFYRPSMGESFRESTVTLAKGGDRAVVEQDDLRWDASYWDDEYEGRSLSVAVTGLGTGEELVRQLYQIDREKGLANQFVGGHGFTGLVYVYHPVSTAEMQYFCQAR